MSGEGEDARAEQLTGDVGPMREQRLRGIAREAGDDREDEVGERERAQGHGDDHVVARPAVARSAQGKERHQARGDGDRHLHHPSQDRKVVRGVERRHRGATSVTTAPHTAANAVTQSRTHRL